MSTPPFEILFEDNHLIVLNKPAGLLSQGEHTGDNNVVDALRQYWGRNYVGLVHRLDRNTSGIMVVAKRTKSAQRLTEALQQDLIQRTYWAWLCGTLRQSARWEHYLRKNDRDNKVTVFKRKTDGAQIATLNVTPIAAGRFETLELTQAEFVLETGRTHQIRAQAAAEKLPLLGDRKYGAPTTSFERPALHSRQIRFPHPMSGETLQFEAKLPEDLKSLI